MINTEKFAQVEVTTAAELRAWLEAHHGQEASVWLVTYKKHMGSRYVSREQVLDELLCFGWIDGLRRVLDDERTMQLISPRRHQRWAKSYKERVARLQREGRMAPAGLAAIAESQRLGLWESLADVDELLVPDDLAAALSANPPADTTFAAFAPSYRRNVLRWIAIAKTPATRAKRIEQAATLAAQGRKVPQL
jgi:uncharacterized protein YdeI (YjbR/CyaY-like superfamily)